jgi:fructokinase
VGEAVWDLFADVPGASLRAHRTHVRHVGGVEANLASTLARLGVETRLVTTVGADPLGEGLVDALAADGVVVSARRLALRTPVVFVDVAPDGARRFLPYRAATADGALAAEDLDELSLDGVGWLHLSGSVAASTTARAPAERLLHRARERGVRVSLDLNARPWQWADPAGARAALERWTPSADLAKGSEEDLRALGWGEGDEAIARFFDACVTAAVVTRGPRGAVARVGAETIEVVSPPLREIDATGAGDAFMAGLLARLSARSLDAGTLRSALELADALARDVVVRLGARPSDSAVLEARRALRGWGDGLMG